MSETKDMSLLLVFEQELTQQNNDLAVINNSWRSGLKEAIGDFFDDNKQSVETTSTLPLYLLAKLQLRAQEELLGENDLLLVDQAARLAFALEKLACQSVEIDAARQISVQRQDFSANVTHDLKNPLTGANRILELLIDGRLGTLTDQQSKLLELIRTSNDESLALIRALTDVYRIEGNPGEIDLQPCDLRTVVKASFDQMQSWSVHRNIHTNLTMPDLASNSRLDPLSVRRLMDNLLSNAVKFVSSEGSIDVRLTYAGGESIIDVKDDGVVISEVEKMLLFQRFSQCEEGKRYADGSGLGL